MNDPTKIAVDIDEQRAWLLAHKADTKASWPEIGKQIGLPHGTISTFGTNHYAGDNEKIAQAIFRFRQHLAAQAELDIEAPEIPGFVETATAKRLLSLFKWGHKGRMIAAALGPGTGKSITARHYRDSVSNVWMATMTPSTANMNNMQIALLEVMGERDAHGSSQMLSRRIRDRVTASGGLILLDEAQHLTEKSLEEIRGWHDATGVGIVLLGNESVVGRLEGGARKAAYAQLFSRIAMRHIQNLPLELDARAIAEAWRVTNEREMAFIIGRSQLPGGLRSVSMMLELATMLAASEGRPRDLKAMQDAWAQLVSRPLAA